ncbi:stage III sporulation protein AF [Rossellomorea vietnamensis]|jgi:stage III sporulation protein AF|uniref:Stage III sporulation protein AF n=1 Tax=Rossellomorea aquimaris TaxID=189382 RepID=A0A5D4T3R0_9BACI|nr:stage III sporulation protein AF [Rossellomorea aquimaris]TYS69965.1 stage III sporulation protein AF [Rossellomorea aquimaris]
MSFLTEWITNIIVFILLASVVDMLLPSSNMQKYTKVVTGLLLITIILTPLMKLFSADFEETIGAINLEGPIKTASVENSVEMKKKEIQASQRAYILEQMAVQMKNDVEEEMMNQYDLTVTHIQLEAEDLENLPESILSVSIHLDTSKEEAVTAIKTVEIDTSKSVPKDESSDGIQSMLSEKWNIPEDKLVIMIEGGAETKNEI